MLIAAALRIRVPFLNISEQLPIQAGATVPYCLVAIKTAFNPRTFARRPVLSTLMLEILTASAPLSLASVSTSSREGIFYEWMQQLHLYAAHRLGTTRSKGPLRTIAQSSQPNEVSVHSCLTRNNHLLFRLRSLERLGKEVRGH